MDFGVWSDQTLAKIKTDIAAIKAEMQAARLDRLRRAVQNAILKPNEAWALAHRPPGQGGDQLMIQGARVPIGSQRNTVDGFSG